MADSTVPALTELAVIPNRINDYLYIADGGALDRKINIENLLGGHLFPKTPDVSDVGSQLESYNELWARGVRAITLSAADTVATFDNSQILGATGVAGTDGTAWSVSTGPNTPSYLVGVYAKGRASGTGKNAVTCQATGAAMVGCSVDSTGCTQASTLSLTGVGATMVGTSLLHGAVSLNAMTIQAAGQQSLTMAAISDGFIVAGANVNNAARFGKIIGSALTATAAQAADLKTTAAAIAPYTVGHAIWGTIESGGIGAAWAGGNMNGSGRTLANGAGSFSWINNLGSGNSDLTGAGSQMWGQTTGATPIAVSAANATQWGPGTNRNIDTGQWGVEGTGIAVKGTAGAFANVADGQVRNNAGVIELRSNGVDFKLVQSAAFTTSGVTTPSRTLADADTDATVINVLAALINDLKLSGLIL